MEQFIMMTGTLLQGIITSMIADKLSAIRCSKKIFIAKILYLCINVMIYRWVKEYGTWKYSAGILLEMISLGVYILFLKQKKILNVFAIIMAVSIINILLGVIAAFISYILFNAEVGSIWYYYELMAGYLLKFLPLYVLYICEKKYHLSLLMQKKRVQIMVVIIGMIFLIARQPFYLLAEESGTLFLSVSLTVLIMGSAMGILWLVDYYLSEKERRRLAEDNQRMAARLHKSKEILPVLSKNLKDIKDKENVRVDGELLEEVWQLCEEQLIQDEKEALEYKFFPETGFRLLDDLIRLYGKEAAKKGIQFDLFVKDDMGKALKKQEIQRLDFLRIIGDLLRNAFHAVEKQQDTAGNILLSMGCINGVLVVDIYDNGVHFPVNILNAIGIRGNTDGGTGHGLADLFEYLEEHKVTFTLTEYDSDDMFTKGISLIWDGENGRWFDSPRTGVLEDRCILKLVETHRI